MRVILFSRPDLFEGEADMIIAMMERGLETLHLRKPDAADERIEQLLRTIPPRLRNRIVWTFGHGQHCQRRFSGRYEVVLWYTKSDDYIFHLDPVRVPAKYPGKRAFRGPRKGQLSGNPLGKNPSDVWEIPNVSGNHVEKTAHPCQFPVALVERLVLALTDVGGVVFDPFCGVATSGVAALLHQRRYVGWYASCMEKVR